MTLQTNPSVPLFITVPHSGEDLPVEADWLQALPREVQLLDIDRFVNQLYEPAVVELQIPWVLTRVHRYAVDLNRYPTDVDQDSVIGAVEPSGKHPNGFHWVKSTHGHALIPHPMSLKLHDEWVRRYHDVFHEDIAHVAAGLRTQFLGLPLYHLDCHSMPSRGTGAHRDSGKARAEVVVSDVFGASSSPEFKDLVMNSFLAEGFEVAYNWPYSGGRITQRYGQPLKAHHTIQIELNRKIYMDETTREKLLEFPLMQMRLKAVLTRVIEGIVSLNAPVMGSEV